MIYFTIFLILSSPEHNVIMMSFSDRPSSVDIFAKRTWPKLIALNGHYPLAKGDYKTCASQQSSCLKHLTELLYHVYNIILQ